MQEAVPDPGLSHYHNPLLAYVFQAVGSSWFKNWVLGRGTLRQIWRPHAILDPSQRGGYLRPWSTTSCIFSLGSMTRMPPVYTYDHIHLRTTNPQAAHRTLSEDV